ncbi:matrixin family metalloprotease, partial [bacterium]|nr:matrixin family metalloprotease [bacterium]
CSSDHAVGCTHYHYASNGQYAKNFVTIGTKEYVYTRNNGKISRKIVTRSKNHIYGVMLHEAGHAIGLGHSESKGSIMYPYDLDDMQYLTKADMLLFYKKYH